ncbi:MAG: hypothetical protein V7699_07445 [Porticoccus sp.]
MFANRKTIIALLLLAVTAALSTASISTNYGEKSSQAAPALFQGTYYTVNDGTIGGTITFHSDGTVSSIVADMFGFAEGRQFRRSTPSQGVWRKVNNNSIQVTTTVFFTEQNGDHYDPDGLIVKVKFLAVFDDPVKGITPGYKSRNLVAEVFVSSQNPNTDTPVSIIELFGNEGFRLEGE